MLNQCLVAQNIRMHFVQPKNKKRQRSKKKAFAHLLHQRSAHVVQNSVPWHCIAYGVAICEISYQQYYNSRNAISFHFHHRRISHAPASGGRGRRQTETERARDEWIVFRVPCFVAQHEKWLTTWNGEYCRSFCFFKTEKRENNEKCCAVSIRDENYKNNWSLNATIS